MSEPPDDATEVPAAGSAPAPGALDIRFLSHAVGVTELVLVRHGEQDMPPVITRVARDIVDPPLSELGRAQAAAVGAHLAGIRIDALYASPLQRARDTGAAIGKHHAMTPVIVDELREIEVFRDLDPDGSIVEQLGARTLLGVRERMIDELRWDVYPRSEGSAEFRSRVVTAIEGIAASHAGERVVIACHGGVINAYITHHLGIDADLIFRPAHASISTVAVKGRIRAIWALNETSHLRPDLVSF